MLTVVRRILVIAASWVGCAAGVALGSACHSDEPLCLSDSFDDSSLDELRWSRLGEAPLAVAGGTLQLTAPAGLDDARAGIESIETLDLSGRSVSVRLVASLPADAHTSAELAIVSTTGGPTIAIREGNGVLALITDGSSQTATTFPVDPGITHWGIGVSNGQISFDLGDFRTLTSTPGVDVTSVQVRLSVVVAGVPAQAGTARFDDLRVDQGACTSPDRYRDHNLQRATTLP